MRRFSLPTASICFAAVLSVLPSTLAASISPEDNRTTLDPDFARFVAEKKSLEKELSEKHNVSVPSVIWTFFEAVQKGQWESASNIFYKIETLSGRKNGVPGFSLSLWGPIHDTFGTYEQFHSWNPELIHRFGEGIINSIPSGSIYFGGTDAGRFVISSLSRSHNQGLPFFTITQNALADGSYLDYVRDLYGDKINIPTPEDAQEAFKSYLADAQRRMENKQLKDGETVRIIDNRVQVSGVVAVMAINERLVKRIIENNPSREIYLEESYALETLYGQAEPHGLVMKLNHQPLDHLSDSIIETDRQFWTAECRALIGEVVKSGTSVPELCNWCEKVFLHPESTAFDGDPRYVKDAQAPQYFSQCRSAIAALYEWRSKHVGKSESTNLVQEADFAHRQAVALSPYNPAVVIRYTDFLLGNQRTNDAKVLISTMLRLDPAKHMEIDSDKLKESLQKLRAKASDLAAVFRE